MKHLWILFSVVTIGLFSCAEKTRNIHAHSTTYKINKFGNFDTITPLGWKIQYLVNKDSTVFYLKWSKDQFEEVVIDSNHIEGVYIDSNQILWDDERGYRPTYSGESQINIYMAKRCATECDGLMVLSKTAAAVKFFYNVVKFDTVSDRVVYVDPYAERFKLTFGIFDFKSMKDTVIKFNNVVPGDFYPAQYIDSIHFFNNRIYISANLLDTTNPRKPVKIREQKIIPM